MSVTNIGTIVSPGVILDRRTQDELQPPCEVPGCDQPAEMLAWLECQVRGVHPNEGREHQYLVCGRCVETARPRVAKAQCGCGKVGTLRILTVQL